MVIAKVLDGFVDDSFMNEGIIPHSCPKCLQIFKRIVNPEFTISPKKLVISDIQKIGIVSENFKIFCIQNKYPDLVFIPIQSAGYYYFESKKIYPINTDHPSIELSAPCLTCCSYRKALITYPIYSK